MTLTTTFIGGGNMASALIGGRIAAGARAQDIRVVEPLAAQRESLSARFAGLGLFEALSAEAVGGADLVVLAVKPQQIRNVARALAPHVEGVGAVLSIAAGIRTGDLSRWLGGYARIVRAMPNTPALVGAGISGIYAAPSAGDDAREAAATILRAAGDIVWCEREEALDGITGVSGSGPAYVFYVLEGLAQGARALGFSDGDGRRLAYATVAGAMALAQKSEADPATLRAQVTSKGGTTERAIATLDAHGVKDALIAAVRDAAARAGELGDEFGRAP